jgi:hypothetical protein
MIKAQSVEIEYIHPHLGHSLKSLLEKNEEPALTDSYNGRQQLLYQLCHQGHLPHISPGIICKLEQVFEDRTEVIMYHQVKRDL